MSAGATRRTSSRSARHDSNGDGGLARVGVPEVVTARGTIQLLNAPDVPLWYRHNDYVLTGYRPITASVRRCLASLGYIHNETVNIYSHLIPAVTAIIGNGMLASVFQQQFPLASVTDRLVFHVYLTTCIACFGISSAYHTLLCHSPYYNDLWGRLDYVAIIFQILGAFISGIYIGFYCEPTLQKVYWIMIGTLGLLTGFVVVNPRLQGKKWRILRLATFVATGFSAFAPIIHAATIFPYDQLDKQAGLRYYYLEGFLILIGVIFYGTHFPERWKPVTFDIWGASHQLFHVFVVLGGITHLYGIWTAFRWNYENPRC